LEYGLVPKKSWIHLRKIKKGLQTDFIGQEIHHFGEVSSTNEVAKALASEGAPEGTVVIAETQTHGRGRLERRWVSPAGGMWFSMILRPRVDPKDAPKLTFVAAVAVARVIRNVLNLKAELKWPNDVLIGEKKVCGILTEASTKGGVVNFVVVGIGINANVSLDLFPESLRDSLTSLKAELGEEIERESFLRVLFGEMERHYWLLTQQGFGLILEEWRPYAGFLGQSMEVVSFDEKIRGQAVDVDENGALIIRLEDGTLRRAVSGDVIVRKQPSI